MGMLLTHPGLHDPMVVFSYCQMYRGSLFLQVVHKIDLHGFPPQRSAIPLGVCVGDA